MYINSLRNKAKRQRLSGWIQKARINYMMHVQEMTLSFKDTESQRMEKEALGSLYTKRTWSGDINMRQIGFRTRNTMRDKYML